MFEALIFDFDGVVIDSEPIHMAGFAEVMRAECSVEITAEMYYQRYLAYADADAFAAMNRDFDLRLDADGIARLTAVKTVIVQKALAMSSEALSGAVELMLAARAGGAHVAICSGALRAEIELPLDVIGATHAVELIVAAEDVAVGKPDPMGYDMTRRRLAERHGGDLPAENCVVVEDSPYGVTAGKAAGMAVLAVTNSADADRLTHADCIVDSLAGVTIEQLRQLTER